MAAGAMLLLLAGGGDGGHAMAIEKRLGHTSQSEDQGSMAAAAGAGAPKIDRNRCHSEVRPRPPGRHYYTQILKFLLSNKLLIDIGARDRSDDHS